MAKQTRTQRRIKPKHRAVKPRPVRPLDVAKPDNHEARHEAARAEAAGDFGPVVPFDLGPVDGQLFEEVGR